MKYSKLCSLLAALGLCLSQQVVADLPAILFPPQGTVYNFDDEFDKKPWQEVETQLPPAPREETLIPFYVSPTAQGVFSVDGATISVGSDGVVRYVLVVVAHGGARNVSYEGLRCDTRERRLYAFGRNLYVEARYGPVAAHALIYAGCGVCRRGSRVPHRGTENAEWRRILHFHDCPVFHPV